MCQDLIDKVAIVTGAGQGIGKGLSIRLAKESCKVVVVDINEETAKTTAEEIKVNSPESLYVVADVSSSTDIENMIEQVYSKFGKIDILINNAGILKAHFITDIPEEIWDKTIDINLKGTFLCTKYVSKYMIQQRYGRIINMSSKSGKKGGLWLTAYCSAKFGIIGLTQSVALDLASYGITVNAICPGDVLYETPLWDQLEKEYAQKLNIPPEKVKERYRNKVPMGRETRIEDIANVVVFLCSDDAEFITGQAINVSGGQIMW